MRGAHTEAPEVGGDTSVAQAAPDPVYYTGIDPEDCRQTLEDETVQDVELDTNWMLYGIPGGTAVDIKGRVKTKALESLLPLHHLTQPQFGA